MEKQKLIIALPSDSLKALAKEGIEQGKSRKAYIETILEDKSKELNKKNK